MHTKQQRLADQRRRDRRDTKHHIQALRDIAMRNGSTNWKTGVMDYRPAYRKLYTLRQLLDKMVDAHRENNRA